MVRVGVGYAHRAANAGRLRAPGRGRLEANSVRPWRHDLSGLGLGLRLGLGIGLGLGIWLGFGKP